MCNASQTEAHDYSNARCYNTFPALKTPPLDLVLDDKLGISVQCLRVRTDLDGPLALLDAECLVEVVPVRDGVCLSAIVLLR